MKIPKRKTVVTFLLFVLFFTQAQSQFLKYPSDYEDEKIVSSLEDSLAKTGVDTFIVFLPQEIQSESSNDYFIWLKNGVVNVIRINDTSGSNIQQGKNLFTTKMNLNKIAVLQKEDCMMFRAPLLGSTCDFALIKIGKKEFEIDHGVGVDLCLDSTKNAARKTFLDALYNSLPDSQNWICTHRYDRWNDPSNEKLPVEKNH